MNPNNHPMAWRIPATAEQKQSQPSTQGCQYMVNAIQCLRASCIAFIASQLQSHCRALASDSAGRDSPSLSVLQSVQTGTLGTLEGFTHCAWLCDARLLPEVVDCEFSLAPSPAKDAHKPGGRGWDLGCQLCEPSIRSCMHC